MNLSSGSSTKGFILAALLPELMILMLFYTFYAIETHHEMIQQKWLAKMDRFSLIEMSVLKKTTDAFMSFDPKDFTLDLGGIEISVEFEDETATIYYGEPVNVIGILHFDMVFESVLEYRLERASDSD